MRRIGKVMVMAVLLVAFTGGAVLAATINGRAGGDGIYGLAGDDLLIGGRGNDTLWERFGDDMFGGDGPDRIGDAVWNQPQGGSFAAHGGAGDDRINAEDHHFEVQDGTPTPDTVECGPVEDTVKAESDDTVADDCEHVQIVVH
jgi:Ca2+-binding RTX toxin-like protein